MSDDFDDIINNQPEDDGKKPETILEEVAHIWPKYYGGIFVSGVILAEYLDADGERVMRFASSPDMTPWGLLGMLESARLDAQRLSQYATIDDNLLDTDEEDD